MDNRPEVELIAYNKNLFACRLDRIYIGYIRWKDRTKIINRLFTGILPRTKLNNIY